MANSGDSCIKPLSECLSIYRGDAVSFDLDLDLDGQPLNLNDYKIPDLNIKSFALSRP